MALFIQSASRCCSQTTASVRANLNFKLISTCEQRQATTTTPLISVAQLSTSCSIQRPNQTFAKPNDEDASNNLTSNQTKTNTKKLNNSSSDNSSNNQHINLQTNSNNNNNYYHHNQNDKPKQIFCVTHHQQQQRGLNRRAQDEEALKSKYERRLKQLDIWTAVDACKRSGFLNATNLNCFNNNNNNEIDSNHYFDHQLISKPLQTLAWNKALIEKVRNERANEIVNDIGAFLTINNSNDENKQNALTVDELLTNVERVYCKSGCGIEFAHLSNEHEINFLTERWELLASEQFDEQTRINFAKLLLECETFDLFLAKKFPTTKRYGLEGGESLLLCVQELLRLSSLHESIISDVVIGAPHRGRLNLMCCLLGFKPAALFSKMRGNSEFDSTRAGPATGDVLSHLSMNVRYVYGLDKPQIGLSRDSPDPINVTLLPNPSHLEVASPMTLGVARGRAHNLYYDYSSSPKFALSCKQFTSETMNETTNESTMHNNYDSDNDGLMISKYKHFCKQVLPIQLHGDASFAGQGIVQETLQLSQVDGHSVAGSVHIVVNNQIGYTTEPAFGRSSRHCTDALKQIEAPVLHVNGDNVDAVVKAARLAFEYRQTFNKDIGINLICYRRRGHNELDDPTFTQPKLYDYINNNQKSIAQKYCDEEIFLNLNKRALIVDSYNQQLQTQYKLSDYYKPDNDNYRNFNLPVDELKGHLYKWKTGYNLQSLQEIALATVKTSASFNVHPTIKRAVIDTRRAEFSLPSMNNNNNNLNINKQTKSIDDCNVDWATSELLALGSLLEQDYSVRLVGQDVARGTFSTRHATLFDRQTNKPFTPLNNMKENQKFKLEVINSILSEEAVLASEYGFSIETCALTIWEAQFGDFFNTAQSIIDTLIASGERKWLKQSPLVMLLPHGLEGMGPEHSSARIERFLALTNSSLHSVDTEALINWSVCNPTMPSQYFHLLRRQVLRPFRKPLVVMTPKAMLRNSACTSRLSDFNMDSGFHPVLDDPMHASTHVNCSTTTTTPETAMKTNCSVDTLVFCSGKVYFALDELRRKEQARNVAIVRIEELCPFPIQQIATLLSQKYKQVNVENMHWLQEEHENQGAFSFVDARLRSFLNINLNYIGRNESESPAVGCPTTHKKEFENLMRKFKVLLK